VTSHAHARSRLLAERASLRCLLTGLDYDPSANGKDSGDLAMANERKESTSRDIERALTKIGDIDAALARIGAGTYGVCDACARPVSAVRLKALPTTLHCLDCAARLERESDDRKYRGAAAYPADVEDE